MADSRRAALELIAAARTHGRTYAVMQNRRFHPSIRSLREFLAEGHIGRVTTVHADFVIAPHFGGFREAGRHVLLRDMAFHTFDSSRFLGGEAPIVAHGMSWNPEGSRVTC